jgi:hypothetical protein
MLDLRQHVFSIYGDGFREPAQTDTPTDQVLVRFLDGRLESLHITDCLTAEQALHDAMQAAALDVARRQLEVSAFADVYGKNIPDTTLWNGVHDPIALEEARRCQSAVKKLFGTLPMRPHHINTNLYAWLRMCNELGNLILYYNLPEPLLVPVNLYRQTAINLPALPDDFQTIRKGARKADALSTYGIMGYVRFPKPPVTVPFSFKRWATVRGERQLVEDMFTPQPFGGKVRDWVEIGNYRLAWALEALGWGEVTYPHKQPGIDTPGPLAELLAV